MCGHGEDVDISWVHTPARVVDSITDEDLASTGSLGLLAPGLTNSVQYSVQDIVLVLEFGLLETLCLKIQTNGCLKGTMYHFTFEMLPVCLKPVITSRDLVEA